MCGIAGIVNLGREVEPIDRKELFGLLQNIRHRGPDYSGVEQVNRFGLLGCNRLSITDHDNKLANMPLSSAGGEYTVVANGEIYNHLALRAELVEYKFQTYSDTEVIIAAYERWGEECVFHLEGMFAFSLYDNLADKFVFAVDPSGQKPLYFLLTPDSFVFASEIGALIKDRSRKKTWDLDSITEIAACRFTVGSDTHIKEIKKLEPGNMLVINGREITNRRYYSIPIGDQRNDSVPRASSLVRDAVVSACIETANVEVPYGALLSGGIDSTVVVGQLANLSLSPKLYSIGFEKTAGDDFGISLPIDEFEYSSKIAADLDCEHRCIRISMSEYFDYLDRWIDALSEPLGGEEGPCLMRLFDEISDDCKVVFCGSGVDEVFDGYGHGESLTNTAGLDKEGVCREYLSRFNWTGDVDLGRLFYSNDTLSNIAKKLESFLDIYKNESLSPMQYAQLINFHGRCPSYEYRQMDIASMSYGTEVRSPLANSKVTAAAFDFNPVLKCVNGAEKWIFKEAVRELVPTYISNRKKEAFPVPIQYWFSEIFEELISSLLEPGSLLQKLGILDLKYLQEVWSRRDPKFRAIFFRLYVLNETLTRQSKYVG